MKSVRAMSVVGAVVVVAALCVMSWAAGAAAPAGGKTVHHSTDFGWTAGQDVTEQFTALLASGKLKAGEELVLDHTFRTSGGHKLPANFTLSAVKGAGFDVPAKPVHSPLLALADGCALRNLTITYLDTPPLEGRGIKHGVDFIDRIGINAADKNDLLIENCALTGSIAHHIALHDCSRVKVIGCHIAGGFWTVVLVGVSDLVFQRCLIEKSHGDGIKTCRGQRTVVQRVLVEDCVFQDNGRDGIDTTGGFADSVIRNTIFRRLGACGMDCKSFYDRPRDGKVDLSPQNCGIRFEKCQFYDVPNAVTFTTIDAGRSSKVPGQEIINAANVKACAPHDVELDDCTVGHVETPLRPTGQGGYSVDYPQQGECMRIIYVKDAYAIRYRNIRFLGDRIMPVYVRSMGGSRELTKEAADALDHSVTGNVLAEPAPAVKPGVTAAPFACGPQ